MDFQVTKFGLKTMASRYYVMSGNIFLAFMMLNTFDRYVSSSFGYSFLRVDGVLFLSFHLLILAILWRYLLPNLGIHYSILAHRGYHHDVAEFAVYVFTLPACWQVVLFDAPWKLQVVNGV